MVHCLKEFSFLIYLTICLLFVVGKSCFSMKNCKIWLRLCFFITFLYITRLCFFITFLYITWVFKLSGFSYFNLATLFYKLIVFKITVKTLKLEIKFSWHHFELLHFYLFEWFDQCLSIFHCLIYFDHFFKLSSF